jgi:hypothetical protein
MFVQRVSLTLPCLRIVAMAAGTPAPTQAAAIPCRG